MITLVLSTLRWWAILVRVAVQMDGESRFLPDDSGEVVRADGSTVQRAVGCTRVLLQRLGCSVLSVPVACAEQLAERSSRKQC